MLCLLGLALLLRVMIPVGWMPAADRGFAITLCTGMGATPAWLDRHGKLHKGEPAQPKTDHPCAFAGYAFALDVPTPAGVLNAPLPAGFEPLVATALAVSIGRGLAAPPPPQTGPPGSR